MYIYYIYAVNLNCYLNCVINSFLSKEKKVFINSRNIFTLFFFVFIKVRSSLAELELQASQALQRLEAIKINPNPEVQPAFKTSTSSTTGLLSNDRYAPTDVLSFLESVIITNSTDPDETDDSDPSEPDYLLPALNEVSHLALISHSIIAYLSHLDYRKLTKITTKISGDTNRWLSHLFRFIDANASYHSDSTDAILRAVRYVLFQNPLNSF